MATEIPSWTKTPHTRPAGHFSDEALTPTSRPPSCPGRHGCRVPYLPLPPHPRTPAQDGMDAGPCLAPPAGLESRFRNKCAYLRFSCASRIRTYLREVGPAQRGQGGRGAPLWEVRPLASGFLELLGQHWTPSPAVPGAAFARGSSGRGAGAGHSPEHPGASLHLRLSGRYGRQAGGDAARR